jgi:hypothetical protein
MSPTRRCWSWRGRAQVERTFETPRNARLPTHNPEVATTGRPAPSPHWHARRHSCNELTVRWISRVGQNAVRRYFKRVEAMSSLSDLAINLLASVIAGLAVFTAQRAQRRRVLGKRRRFFGAYPDRTCMICAPRWAGSTTPASVSRFDVVALIEVATIIKECGSSVELASQSDQAVLQNSLGDRPEFCIGGPEANTRMSAHLQTFLPQVKYDKYAEVGAAVTLHIGNSSFVRQSGEVEYVLLGKITSEQFPIFAISGQTAISNSAAAKYLAMNYKSLISTYGLDGRFCLLLKVVNSQAYGNRKMSLVGDYTSIAFSEADADGGPTGRKGIGAAADMAPETDSR